MTSISLLSSSILWAGHSTITLRTVLGTGKEAPPQGPISRTEIDTIRSKIINRARFVPLRYRVLYTAPENEARFRLVPISSCRSLWLVLGSQSCFDFCVFKTFCLGGLGPVTGDELALIEFLQDAIRLLPLIDRLPQ